MTTVNRRTGNLIAGILALVLTAGLVVRTSQAAFTSSTNNRGNSVAAGTVTLIDDDLPATALMQLTNLAPGQSQSQCIKVTYNGTIDPKVVKVYSGGTASGTANFDDEVRITVKEGTGTGSTAFRNCTGFVPTATIVNNAQLSTFEGVTGYAGSTYGTWDPTGPGQVRFYEVTLGVDTNTGNAFQGASIGAIEIQWETQS